MRIGIGLLWTALIGMPLLSGAENFGLIQSGQVITNGMIDTVGYVDTFSFEGQAGDEVYIIGVKSGGSGSYTIIYEVLPPGGGAPILEAGFFTSGPQNLLVLPTNGIYIVNLEENGGDETGPYQASYINRTTGPVVTPEEPDDGLTLISGETHTGRTIFAAADMDIYHFQGTAGDRVFLSVQESGSTVFDVDFLVFPPEGGGHLFSSRTK